MCLGCSARLHGARESSLSHLLVHALLRLWLTHARTFHRSAPELLMGHNCTTKADIYSFGVVLWEIVTGELPVRGQMRATQ